MSWVALLAERASAGPLIMLAAGATPADPIGVPGVFVEADPQQRLRMLTAHLTRWRTAQPPYGLGPIVAAVGVGYLAAAAQGRGEVAEFARGTPPGWPFGVVIVGPRSAFGE